MALAALAVTAALVAAGAVATGLVALAALVLVSIAWESVIRRRDGGHLLASRVFDGYTVHARFKPVYHSFKYPLFCVAVVLEELPRMQAHLPLLFGYNTRWRPFAICDRDYLGPGPGSIRDKLVATIKLHDLPCDFARVELVTMPRYFGYAFNPVSFYYCYHARDLAMPEIIVAEVNNTFGESFVYCMHAGRRQPTARHSYLASFQVPRAFHVSPFNDRNGVYEMHFSDLRRRLDIVLVMRQADKEKHLFAQLRGEPSVFGSRALARMLLQHPVTVLLTFPRILMQAAILTYGRPRLPVYVKPDPIASTVRTLPPSPWEASAMALWRDVWGKPAENSPHDGKLVLMPPSFADPPEELCLLEGRGRSVSVRLTNYALPAAVACSAGWAELAMSYAAGSWHIAGPTTVPTQAPTPWTARVLPPVTPTPEITVDGLTCLLAALASAKGPQASHADAARSLKQRALATVWRWLAGTPGSPTEPYGLLSPVPWRSRPDENLPDAVLKPLLQAISAASRVRAQKAPGPIAAFAAQAQAAREVVRQRHGTGARVLVVGDDQDALALAMAVRKAVAGEQCKVVVLLGPCAGALARAHPNWVQDVEIFDQLPAGTNEMFDVILYEAPLSLPGTGAPDDADLSVMLPAATILRPGGAVIARTWCIIPARDGSSDPAEHLPVKDASRLAQALPSLLWDRGMSALDVSLFSTITAYVQSPYARRHVHDRLLNPLRILLHQCHAVANIGQSPEVVTDVDGVQWDVRRLNSTADAATDAAPPILLSLALALAREEAAVMAAAAAAPADALQAEALTAVRLALFYTCLLRGLADAGHCAWQVVSLVPTGTPSLS